MCMNYLQLTIKHVKNICVYVLSCIPLYSTLVSPEPALIQPISLVANNWCPQHCEKHPIHEGYIVEIITQALKAVELESTVEYRPWLRAIQDTSQNTFDGLLTPSISETTQLLKHKVPIAYQRFCFYTLKKSTFELRALSDFKGRSISFAEGNNLGHEFMSFIHNDKNNVTVKTLTTDNNDFAYRAFNYLIFKRTSAIAITEDAGDFFLGENPSIYGKVKKSYCTPAESLHVGLSTKNREKAEKIAYAIDKGILIIQENGKYQKILDKYHLKDIPN